MERWYCRPITSEVAPWQPYLPLSYGVRVLLTNMVHNIASMKSSSYVCLVLGQRRRRWPNIKPIYRTYKFSICRFAFTHCRNLFAALPLSRWHKYRPWSVLSYELLYIVGFGLVEMAISTNQKPTIYRNLYGNTDKRRFLCNVNTARILFPCDLNAIHINVLTIISMLQCHLQVMHPLNFFNTTDIWTC